MAQARRRTFPIWFRITAAVLAVLMALAGTAVFLRYWITSDGGRGFLVSQIDGRRIGPLGTIRISGLDGDPLEAATVADIALVDDDGVWLRARNARIEWSPFRLLGGDLEIAAIEIRTIDVLRRPRTTYESKKQSSIQIGVNLQDVTVHELKLAQGVVGPAANFSVDGGVSRARDASGFARLNITPLNGPGDRLRAEATWSAAGALNGEAKADGPAGGALAALLQSPVGAPVVLDVNVAGTLAEFRGGARLTFADDVVASVEASRTGDTATLSAEVAADRWPLLEPVASRTGGGVTIDIAANIADLSRATLTADIAAPAGRAHLSTLASLDGFALLSPITTTTDDLDLALVAPPLSGRVDSSGEVRIASLGNWSWTGDADVTDLDFPSGSAARVTGHATVAQQGRTISWSTQDAIVEGGRIEALKNLAPDRYQVSTRGELNLSTRIIEITRSLVRGQPGEVSARGTYAIESGALDLAGAAALARLSDVAPLTGSARGQWSVKRNSASAPIRITADGAGRNVGASVAALEQLVGPSPRIIVAAVVQGGRFTIESGRFDGAGVEARMTGRVGDDGAIAARATGQLRRPLDLGSADIRSLEFAASITGQISAPRIDLDVSNGALAAAGLSFSGIEGMAQAVLGERTTGRYVLTGRADGQALAIAGDISGGDGAWRLNDTTARIGGLTITAPLLAYADGDVSAVFSAAGSLAGLAEIERGALTAQGNVKTTDGVLALDVTGQATGIRRGAARIQLVSFDASAAGDSATVSGRLRGRLGADMDLTFTTSASRADTAWTGEATASGSIDELPVSTAEPVKWAYGPEGWSVDGAISALDGRIEATLASGDAGHTTRMALSGIDLAALTRLARVSPVAGRISGLTTFSNANGVAVADIDLALENANPVGVTADPAAMTLKGQLRDGRFSAKASGSGQGFRLEASALVPFDIGDGFDVRPSQTAPLTATLSLTGRAAQLWALFGPEDQTLRGAIKTDIRVAGTLASPTLDGDFSIDDGLYQHGETGLNLRQISAKGVFDQRSARLTSLTANDGSGGTLTGDGDIDWSDSLKGSVRFSATNLRALARDDRSAVMSGKGAVTIAPDAYVVSGDFQVAQARISIEQPASASIPTLPGVRRVNFPGAEDEGESVAAPARPVRLQLKVVAPRRIVVFGRGLDTEWSADLNVTGSVANPSVAGTATLVRGTLDLAGQRFDFDTGSIRLDGPIRTARINIAATRDADDVDAIARVTGTPNDLKFTLESTPALPQDEILARVLFGRSASELSGLEAAQLAASLAQLAGGQGAFDPAGILRSATGLDRVAIGASGGVATVQAGKYIADDVYLQLGAGGEGGVGAAVEWEPVDGVSITSSAQGNGDSRIAVRWKKDY